MLQSILYAHRELCVVSGLLEEIVLAHVGADSLERRTGVSLYVHVRIDENPKYTYSCMCVYTGYCFVAIQDT